MKIIHGSIQSALRHKITRYPAIYLAVLLLSHGYAYLFSPPAYRAEMGTQTILVKQEGRGGEDETVALRYFDVPQKSSENSETILLLHPNPPVSNHDLEKLIFHLSSHARVIAPKLPGFGYSTRDISDFSYPSQAAYLSKLMEKAQVQKAHIVAIGWSGPLAMTLADREPDRIASVVLLSSLGVEQLQLLGSYQINHALYGFQLGLVYLFELLVPDFGISERYFNLVSYARGYFETDLRPMRGYLKAYQGPMLIVHGMEDALVPVATARETHRLVPQSRLALYPFGHDLAFEKSSRVADRIGKFIVKARTKGGMTRSEANPEKVALADIPAEQIVYPAVSGLALALLMVIIALSSWISEELAGIGAGLLAARGIIGFWQASMAVFFGVAIANMSIFFAGKFLGPRAFKTVPFKWFVKPEAIARSSRWFESKGPLIILVSRFIPASRIPVYLAAGVLNHGVKSFTLYFLGSCLVWTPIIVGLSLAIGQQMFDYFDIFRQYSLFILMALAVLISLFWIVFKRKGRN